MTDLVTINTDNYATMAKAMGLPTSSGEKKTNVLNRFRIWHNPTMGMGESKGKSVKMEVVEGGFYRLEDRSKEPSVFYFSEKVEFRPFLQRFLYKKYRKNHNAKEGEKQGTYIKTIMSDTLNIDLKDDDGTFNCGKPTGYVKDFQALPEETKRLIKEIKRNRAVFGLVKMIDPVKGIDGDEIQDVPEFPVIWEIDNRDAYKSIGDVFSKFAKMEALPLQHVIKLDGTKENKLNNGGSFYTPIVQLDTSNKVEITDADHKVFGDFLDFVKAYNDSIISKWDDRVAQKQDDISDEDMETVEDFIDVELDENAK
tara:strand:+ start:478 stop:1410 length:933 start_codon:yes stop_codon:yes gene_type:complete